MVHYTHILRNLASIKPVDSNGIRLGLIGSDRIGSDWNGLEWISIGLDWIGLDWFEMSIGLDRIAF